MTATAPETLLELKKGTRLAKRPNYEQYTIESDGLKFSAQSGQVYNKEIQYMVFHDFGSVRIGSTHKPGNHCHPLDPRSAK
jgi:hypothetical protein